MLRSHVPLGLLNAFYAAIEMQDEHAKPPGEDGETEAKPLGAEAFEERKRFARFGAADAALLEELRQVFDRHADEVVDRFYEHLGGFGRLEALLVDDGTVDRLRQFQRRYLLRLAEGGYDQGYAADRFRIGEVHSRVGLEPQWYLGTYGLYLDELFPLIHEHFRDRDKASRASAALVKLMLLDMQIVLDSYYRRREKKAVEHSEQLAAVGELAASIAHEVRNPLAGMKGGLQILRKELDTDPAKGEVMDELLAQIDRLEGLVRDLLTYARPRAIERQQFELQDLMDRLLRLYKDELEGRGVTVQRVYGPGTGWLWADPAQLEQVFLNLITNAMQAMEEGGTLTVTTKAADGQIVITFSDTGQGISPDKLDKVTQPFFTTKHRGSGLGLSIVQKITEAHGGRLIVQSEPGRGTTAVVRLPSTPETG